MFFRSDNSANAEGVPYLLTKAPAPCIFAGTQIATKDRWKYAQDLRPDDMVMTAEHGERRIVEVVEDSFEASFEHGSPKHWPLKVPVGVLGNSQAMMLAPDMRVVMKNEAAYQICGEVYVSLRAETLIGYAGIARAQMTRALDHVTVRLEQAETLLADGGVFLDIPGLDGVLNFTPLSDSQARVLVRHLGGGGWQYRARKVSVDWI